VAAAECAHTTRAECPQVSDPMPAAPHVASASAVGVDAVAKSSAYTHASVSEATVMRLRAKKKGEMQQVNNEFEQCRWSAGAEGVSGIVEQGRQAWERDVGGVDEQQRDRQRRYSDTTAGVQGAAAPLTKASGEGCMRRSQLAFNLLHMTYVTTDAESPCGSGRAAVATRGVERIDETFAA
jgi:hypothetical protein